MVNAGLQITSNFLPSYEGRRPACRQAGGGANAGTHPPPLPPIQRGEIYCPNPVGRNCPMVMWKNASRIPNPIRKPTKRKIIPAIFQLVSEDPCTPTIAPISPQLLSHHAVFQTMKNQAAIISVPSTKNPND